MGLRRYKEGVYAEYNDDMTPNHMVSVIGWGVENATDYWCVDSSLTKYSRVFVTCERL